MKIQNVTIRGKEYQLVSEFRDDTKMREKFYKLPQEFFCVDFKAWYEAGYWGDWYNPHCLLYKGEVVSNVGVSKQEYMLQGQKKNIIQLGSVVTCPKYRGEGVSRYLIEYVIEAYREQAEAIMLFGNDSVLEFYPKFGFEKAREHCFIKYVNKIDKNYEVRKLDSMSQQDRRLVDVKANKAYKHAFFATNYNRELLGLYWEIFKCVELYYISQLDTIVVAEYGEDTLEIQDVYGDVLLEEVIEAMCSKQYTKVILGFTPIKQEGYENELYKEEDATLFILGEKFRKTFEGGKLRFPALSHT